MVASPKCNGYREFNTTLAFVTVSKAKNNKTKEHSKIIVFSINIFFYRLYRNSIFKILTSTDNNKALHSSRMSYTSVRMTIQLKHT